MAHSSYGRGNVSSSINSELRREMSLRRQQEAASKNNEVLPSFPEPRRVVAERQDSITTSIKNVLGDIHMVSRNIEHQPNIWLGTSRASGSGGANKSADNKTSSREASSKSNQQSRRSKSQHSNSQHQTSSSLFSPRDSEPSRVESPKVSSHEMKRHSSKHHSTAQHHSSSYNTHHKTVKRENELSNFEQPDLSKLENEDDNTEIMPRDRLQSVDMPNAVEHIFQEMQLMDRLTDIQTPSVMGKEFSFLKKNENHKADNSSNYASKDHLEEQPMSESDSSDEESEESEESDVEVKKVEEEETKNKWSLDTIMKDYQNDNIPAPTPSSSSGRKSRKEELSRSSEQSSQSSKRQHTRGRQNEKAPQKERNKSPSMFQDKVKKEREDKREGRSRSNSKSRRSSSNNKSSSPKPSAPRNPPKLKESPLVRSNDAERKQKRGHDRGRSSKDVVQSKTTITAAPKVASPENRYSSSVNNNSNNPCSGAEPPCTVKTVSKRNLAASRHHVGRKDPANMKYRVAEKKTKMEPVASSGSDSDSSKSSGNSSSEEEEEVEVRSSPRILLERSNSSSSTKSKSRKIPEKSPDAGRPKTSDRRSAPCPLIHDKSERIAEPPRKSKNPESDPKPKARPPSNEMEETHVKKHKSPTALPKPKKSHRRQKAAHKAPTFPSLWVHLQTNPQHPVSDSNQKQSAFAQSRVDFPARSIAKLENIKSPKSTGSETEQPKIRTANIQITDAVSSSDISTQGVLPKRKQPNPATSHNHPKSKRIKRETPSPVLNESANHSHQSNENQNREDSNSQWRERRSLPNNTSAFNNQQYLHPSSNQPRQTNENQRNPLTSVVASIVSEPDSSWPEKEKLLKSDQYMREGKRLKHEGDAYTDARTGRTRPGEALSRALVYFEAALCFVMNGFMLEMENGNDRSDSSSSSNGGAGSSPTSMYHQTISLMDYIRKMRPHDDQEGTAFKRLNLSCIRCQALLYLRVYLLKKDAAAKYSELINEQFKQFASKSNRTPSPWHNVNGQNVSPMSPAVPSPYGSALPGPSPIGVPGCNYEPVSSSTQPTSKMTSPPSQSSVMLPHRMYEVFKHYHTIMNSVMLSHDKWDQAEALLPEHADFFRNVDTLCGHVVTLRSSLRDMVTYNKAVLRQLRADYVTSPRE